MVDKRNDIVWPIIKWPRGSSAAAAASARNVVVGQQWKEREREDAYNSTLARSMAKQLPSQQNPALSHILYYIVCQVKRGTRSE